MIIQTAARSTNLIEQATHLGIRIQTNAPLAPLTTIRVGGPAEYFAAVATLTQLQALVQWAQSQELPYFVLGGGSNILIADAGVRGLVIHNRCRRVHMAEPAHASPAQTDQTWLTAESGAAMAGVARTSLRAGWSGLEWAVSVPGTVGGAVIGNAGAHGGEVKDNLISARLVTIGGDVQAVAVAEFAYAYRASAFKHTQRAANGLPHPLRAGFGPVVLDAMFGLQRAETAVLKERADQFLSHRRRTQPVAPSLGSTFMNPPGDYAGRLIEAAGLKGARIGGAEVSQLHANFLTNPGGVGGATADDVLALIMHIQETVEAQFGVRLMPEVQLIGAWNI